MKGIVAVIGLYVGIDVAAETFTASWLVSEGLPSRPITCGQSLTGYAMLQRRLQATDVSAGATLIVLEATGSYWVALAVALHEAGYQVSVVNPLQAHHFAKAQLRRAKTDNLDAQDLARLASVLELPRWVPPPPVYHEVRQRLVVRDGLVAVRQQIRNQRHAFMQWPVVVGDVLAHCDELIADLDRRIAVLEVQIAGILRKSAWSAGFGRLLSVPGVGVVTAAWLLVATLNFTLCSNVASLSAYVGLVPMPHESGRSVRGRSAIGHGGNGRVRTALYMAVLSASRYNPLIRPFYERLRSAGKPIKVARCAAARKLLHLCWALVVKGADFDAARYDSTMVAQVA